MTENANEITETPADAHIEGQADEAQADTVQSEGHQAVFEHLREAGEAGKKEWEQILVKAGELLTERRAQLKTTVETAFGAAQARGADLLLGVIGQVRKTVVGLEESLREARQEAGAEETPLAA